MHVLLQTGLDNMQAARHGQACMETMLPQRVSLVAPQNVIFHPVGQLAPPTLEGFLLVHLNWCTQPNGLRAAAPKGVRKSPHKNGSESRQPYASCHKGSSIVWYVPTVF